MLAVAELFVKVGMIWSPSDVMNELAGSSVTHSKEPVLLHCQLRWLWNPWNMNYLPATVDKHLVVPDRRIYRLKMIVQNEAVLQGSN